MSYVTGYYHVVFATYRREPVLAEKYSDELYRVLASIIKKKDCKALLVNGVENHIHILLNLNPKVALSDLMRDLKSQSSLWVKNSGKFPMFRKWAHEYGAFSLSASHRQAVYDYIAVQKIHHSEMNLDDEFRRLVIKNGLVYYDWPDKD